MTAVSQFGGALRCIPDTFKSYKLCCIAVSNAGYAIQYVPECHYTMEICKLALIQNNDAMRFIPYEKQIDLILSDWTNIRFFQHKYMRIEFFIICVKKILHLPII